MRKIFTILLVFASCFAFAQSTTLVISQFYGAGGNSGASLNADYIELHNVSNAAISLSGYSIQYSSATNTGTWTGVSPLPLTGSIPAGGYYLIQMGTPGANGSPLPTADYLANPTIALSGTSGKVALVNGVTALDGCPLPAGVVDAVGYGTANCFEGSAATAVLTPTTAAFRNNNGCTDTNNNGADFTVAATAPRNSASAVFSCAGGPPVPTLTAGTVVDFGSVLILTNSASQTFNLSGTNLTGAPGVITITAPSADFQVSKDNTVWASSTTIAYTSATLVSTPVYVRFTPQTVGPKTGNVNIIGGGVSSAVTVAVSGNGVATAVANVSSSPATLAFGNVCVSASGGPNTVTINGTNLSAADLVVGPFTGYSFSTTSGGTYTASLTLTHAAGNYTQAIFVKFTPVTATTYNGNIAVTGGGLVAASNIAVTGTGTSGVATVVTGAASAITQSSATLSGTISSPGCSVVTAYGFEYSTTAGFPNGSGTSVPSSNLTGTAFSSGLTGLLPATTYYYKAFVTNGGGTVYGVQLSFTTSTPPAATLAATALDVFGSTCVGVEVGPNSFTINGTNLSTANVVVGPLTGFSFSTTVAGPYTSALTLTQPGGNYTQTIFVKFMPPANGIYNTGIPVSGAGVTAFSVAVSGIGEEGIATVLTGDASAITPNAAHLTGSVSNFGCSSVFSYGIEYSGINGFVNGSGIKVESTNLSGPDFSSNLAGLVQGTNYYYKAYATNNGGTAYGQQESFTTLSLHVPDPPKTELIIYSTPIIRGQNLHFTLTGITPGHYSVRIHNIAGQLVFQKDYISQVNFLDYTFTLPGYLPIGIYRMEIRNPDFKIQKPFMVQ